MDEKVSNMPRFKSLDLPRILIRRASPTLFAISMGTGGISGLFASFPYGRGSTAMLVLSMIIFFLNLLLFFLFMILLTSKYILYPERWVLLMRNPVNSLFTGCFPMAATTLINVAVQVVHTKFQVGGKGFLYFIWAIWWLDVVLSIFCCWLGVHVMITYQRHSLESMSSMWLLPVVTLIVAASSGGVIAEAIQQYSATYALNTVVVSVFLVTVGLSLALMILTIYLLRLILHGLPLGPSLLSVFLPLGPTGQAGWGILLIGQNLQSLFPPLINNDQVITMATSNSSSGAIVNIVCTCVAFILWSLATMWIIYAFLAIHTGLRKGSIAFRVSFWGLVFPNAVYANLTIQLSDVFDSRSLRVWGAIYAFGTLVLWLSILLRSTWELKVFLLVGVDESPNADIPVPEQNGSPHPSFPQHQSIETSTTT